MVNRLKLALNSLQFSFESAWEKAGLKFDINNPEWGKWVNKDLHRKLSKSYNKEWREWIAKHIGASVSEILEKTREMADYIK